MWYVMSVKLASTAVMTQLPFKIFQKASPKISCKEGLGRGCKRQGNPPSLLFFWGKKYNAFFDFQSLCLSWERPLPENLLRNRLPVRKSGLFSWKNIFIFRNSEIFFILTFADPLIIKIIKHLL